MEPGGPPTTRQPPSALKRAANELMRTTLRDVLAEQPFFCECDDVSCREAVWLSRGEYELLRAEPEWRPLASGHGLS